MSELVDEREKSESENSDLDSDWYDKNDPYAAMAKRIDRRNKVMEEYNKRPLAQVSQKIIENRENMTYFEKHMLKYVFLVALLVYLIYSNVTNPTVAASAGSGSVASSDWSLSSILGDMKREFVMFSLAVGGYIIVANINNVLDRWEEEESALERAKEEAEAEDASDEDDDGDTKKEQ